MNKALTNTLLQVQERYGDDLFLNGDCHTLAVAMMEANKLQGALFACILADTGEYLHMVYRCPQGFSWDIHGDKADLRWATRMFDASTGTTPLLNWVEIPYHDHQIWLQMNYGCVDLLLCNRLGRMISTLLEHNGVSL